jgi:hypothetical protein
MKERFLTTATRRHGEKQIQKHSPRRHGGHGEKARMRKDFLTTENTEGTEVHGEKPKQRT